MTPEETQAAREWAAMKMGWEEVIPASCPDLKYWGKSGIATCCCIIPQEDWQPDIDANQCFMLVERMRKLRWYLRLYNYFDGHYEAVFQNAGCMQHPRKTSFATNHRHAIIKAAMATEKAK